MTYYLNWPRRNRFAVNPVGAANDFVIAANARVVLTLINQVANPVQVSQGVVSPTPVSDAEGETLIGLPTAPTTSAEVFAQKGTSTMTIASPCVVTFNSHGFAANQKVFFTTTGALPTGVVANTPYYVRNPSTNTFELSTVSGGSSLTTSGSQSGTHTLWYKL